MELPPWIPLGELDAPTLASMASLVLLAALLLVALFTFLLRALAFPRVSPGFVAFFHPFANDGGAFSGGWRSRDFEAYRSPRIAAAAEQNASSELDGYGPMSHAGGGERVLWCAIRGLQRSRPDLKLAIYTDASVSPAELAGNAFSKFNIKAGGGGFLCSPPTGRDMPGPLSARAKPIRRATCRLTPAPLPSCISGGGGC